MNRTSFALCALALFVYPACGSAPVQPTVPAYQPSFTYAPTETGESIDVAVGVIAPQFEGQGSLYWSAYQTDAHTAAMVSGLRMGFRELLVATGFTVAGPYDGLEMMTFPEKRGVDFVLYPIIDLAVSSTAQITDTSIQRNYLTGSSSMTYSCDVTVGSTGSIQIVAVEPLSEQLMWVRRIEVNGSPETVSTEGAACQGAAGGDQRVRNAWARAHERVFNETMTALDRYVDGEEFRVLQQQSQEVRENTRY